MAKAGRPRKHPKVERDPNLPFNAKAGPRPSNKGIETADQNILGEFKKGNKLGNRKRVFTNEHIDIRKALAGAFLDSNKRHFDNGDFDRVIDRLYQLALNGDLNAIKLLFDKCLGHNFEVNFNKNENITFTLNVENPLDQKKVTKLFKDKTVIDTEFKEEPINDPDEALINETIKNILDSNDDNSFTSIDS